MILPSSLLSSLLLVSAALAQASISGGDGISENDKLKVFAPKDYVIDLQKGPQIQKGNGGTLSVMSGTTLKALASHRMAMNLITLDPCGMNKPHLHPRATEAIYAIKGSKITLGFIPENGGKVIINVVEEGKATFFPQGYIHFEFNDNCEPAQLLAALNNDDPGTLSVSAQFFKLPDGTIEADLGLDGGDSKQFKTGVQLGKFPNLGIECRKRCGLDLPAPFDQDHGEKEKTFLTAQRETKPAANQHAPVTTPAPQGDKHYQHYEQEWDGSYDEQEWQDEVRPSRYQKSHHRQHQAYRSQH